ncbi:MAG TPA: guanylate kinase [Candidatus Krumholzibacteria bacterium]|nr:guanylate kinase [Candidatus Krumholzibacteria bacterium]HPD71961.1 guanylate kinase [Candidatus Krumholzibacteria bacterium]HRY41106.1 guanylate kinase [Candidatus Krumholzibacteria bacterium]
MILLISGPSGAGKSTVYHELLRRDPRLGFSVSTTTRPARAGEKDGVDYDFVDDAEFDRLVAAGAFLEWARVHDRRYGTRRDQVAALEAAGRIPLLDIDVQGGVQVLDQVGVEVVSVFVWPPSWAALEARLRERGTDSDAVIATRLKNARWEIGYADRYAYWVVNDEVEAAVRRLEAILVAEGCRRERWGAAPVQAPARELE